MKAVILAAGIGTRIRDLNWIEIDKIEDLYRAKEIIYLRIKEK